MESKTVVEATATTETRTQIRTIAESFRRLPNEPLIEQARLALTNERMATAVLVAALAEIDARQLYLARGHSCLRAFCLHELGISDGTAGRRIVAARAVRRFPLALDYLADESLGLTTLTVLAPALTVSTHRALLDAARHKTRREVEEQVAALDPEAEPLVWIRLRIRRSVQDRLRHAQDLLRHVIPSGDVGEIFELALTSLIAGFEKRKLGRVDRPRRASPIKMGSRHIPRAIRRAVMERDGGQCAFLGTEGRCAETGFLEFHHVIPFARGGPTTIENIQLRCRAHNKYESDVAFGNAATN